MKKILIINGHPSRTSFDSGLAQAYKKGALSAGAEVQEIQIGQLDFDPNLSSGYQTIQALEPDLLSAQAKINWADHLLWVHPVWWGGLPAVTKGFIDRVFLPGFAFQYRPDSVWWDKLLKGKTAHIITTLDQPGWYYWLVYGRPSINQLKKCVLKFCGITPVRVTCVGPVRHSNDNFRKAWLNKVTTMGELLQ